VLAGGGKELLAVQFEFAHFVFLDHCFQNSRHDRGEPARESSVIASAFSDVL
jgi:hypothetical protein